MEKVISVQNQIKDSLRKRDVVRLNTFKMLLSKIENRQIELKGHNKDFKEEDFNKIVLGEIKSHQESIAAFEKGGREELAKKEEKELSILQELAPALLSQEEVEQEVAKVIKSLEMADTANFGDIMKKIMGKLKGRVDGRIVAQVVRKALKT